MTEHEAPGKGEPVIEGDVRSGQSALTVGTDKVLLLLLF